MFKMITWGTYFQNFRGFALLLFTFSFSLSLSAQTDEGTDFKDFKIIIEQTKDGIRMKSTEGSAWLKLEFSKNKYQTQAIDEFGMTDLHERSLQSEPNLADYLFTITRTKDGIQLEGMEGTAWKKLGFSLGTNQQQAINQYGMADL